MRPPITGLVATGAALLLLTLVPTTGAAAAPSDGYAAFTFAAGVPSTGTVTLPAGFPSTTFTTNARTTSASPISSGATIYQPVGTPFADRFGQSQNKPYLSLRPASDGSAGAPSTTTYTFASPTPAGTWGFALGDIDAETVTITATGASGTAVAPEDLGYTGADAYNYCAATPRPSGCGTPTPVPTVTADGTTITVSDDQCPTDGTRCNTDGESAYFIPTVPLRSLTIVSTWKQGFPTYQTWFATGLTRIDGTATADCPASVPTSVDLLTPDGSIVGTTGLTDGAYSFGTVAARPDYEVAATTGAVPSGVVIPAARFDASSTNTTAPPLHATSAFTVAGNLTGSPTAVGGRALELVGTDRTTPATTAADGSYVFDLIPPGTYTLTVDPLNGSTATPATRTVTVGCAAAGIDPITVTDLTTTSSPGTPTDPIPSAATLAATGSENIPTGLVGLSFVLAGAGSVVMTKKVRPRSLR